MARGKSQNKPLPSYVKLRTTLDLKVLAKMLAEMRPKLAELEKFDGTRASAVDVMFSAAHAVKPEGAGQPMSAEETSPLGPQSQLLPTLQRLIRCLGLT